PTSVPTSAGRIFKLRFEYDRSGLTSAQAIPYQPRRITRLAIRPLPQDVPLHQLYPLKYRSRSLLDAAGSGLQATEGVVLRYNTWITDAGHASLAFRQGNTWFTPDTPLLPGTTRTRLLREGKLSARRITTTCLQQFSEVCIFNAMLAFGEQRLPISALYYDDDWSYQND
ncbi:MAG: aminotransferase class IV, partial [Spirochaeta sp.]